MVIILGVMNLGRGKLKISVQGVRKIAYQLHSVINCAILTVQVLRISIRYSTTGVLISP
jgi:hypothetical protein